MYLAHYVVLYSSTWVLAPDLFMAWPVTRHLWGVKEKARKGDLCALVRLLQQILRAETGWTRCPGPAVCRWEHVNPLGLGACKVFHLQTIDVMPGEIKLNNRGCIF